MKLHMWVEATGSDDMELLVTVEKLDATGKPSLNLLGEGVTGTVQATGLLRVSQRALDPKQSTASEPYLLNTHEDKLEKGDRVAVDIGIWPMGMKYHAGEQLKLTVAAHRPMPMVNIGFGAAKVPVPVSGGTFNPGEEPSLILLGGKADTSPADAKEQEVDVPISRNNGQHILHLGGKYDSYLLVPEIP